MNTPYWISSSEERSYDALKEDISTDYLIIGGGITGITCLYLLTKAGLNAALIDANRVGFGTSGRNTGKATAQHGYIYSRIEKNYGLEWAKGYYKANSSAIDFIESISKEHNIDCQFKRLPAYLFTQDESFVSKLEKEFEIYQQMGLDCSFEKEIPVPLEVLCALKMNNSGEIMGLPLSRLQIRL